MTQPHSEPVITTIDAGVNLYRIHLADHSAAFFDTSRSGRFNPPEALTSEFGTLYAATSPATAFIETLGRRREVPQRRIDERRLSVVRFTRSLRLLDLAARHNRFPYPDTDIAAEAIVAGTDYPRSQHLAGLVNNDARFEGVIYPARHDIAGRLLAVAVFGPPGEHDDIPAGVTTTTIPDELIEQMIGEFRFQINPTDTLP